VPLAARGNLDRLSYSSPQTSHRATGDHSFDSGR
jgi:hypothetical protein